VTRREGLERYTQALNIGRKREKEGKIRLLDPRCKRDRGEGRNGMPEEFC